MKLIDRLKLMQRVSELHEADPMTLLEGRFFETFKKDPEKYMLAMVKLEAERARAHNDGELRRLRAEVAALKKTSKGTGAIEEKACRNCGFRDSELGPTGLPPTDAGTEKAMAQC